MGDMNKMQKVIQESLNSGMFARSPRASTIKERYIPMDKRKQLKEQWNTPAHSTANVIMRYINPDNGQAWHVTAWDGRDTLAGYTSGGFRNIPLDEVVSKKAIIDEDWDSTINLEAVVEMFPESTLNNGRFMDGKKDRSCELFENILNKDDVVEEESPTLFEDQGIVVVSFNDRSWRSDIINAVSYLENREDVIYQMPEDVNEAFIFAFEGNGWKIYQAEEAATIHANEFVLEIPTDEKIQESAPEDLQLEAVLRFLPSPKIDGLAINYKVEEDQTWIIATGRSSLHEGTTAFLAKDGLPFGMLPMGNVLAKSKEEALKKFMNSMKGE